MASSSPVQASVHTLASHVQTSRGQSGVLVVDAHDAQARSERLDLGGMRVGLHSLDESAIAHILVRQNADAAWLHQDNMIDGDRDFRHAAMLRAESWTLLRAHDKQRAQIKCTYWSKGPLVGVRNAILHRMST